MKFLNDEFEKMCQATYGGNADSLPIEHRLAVEMAFYGGARAYREGLAKGSWNVMDAIEVELTEFGETIVQRHADAGLPTGFPETRGSA